MTPSSFFLQPWAEAQPSIGVFSGQALILVAVLAVPPAALIAVTKLVSFFFGHFLSPFSPPQSGFFIALLPPAAALLPLPPNCLHFDAPCKPVLLRPGKVLRENVLDIELCPRLSPPHLL